MFRIFTELCSGLFLQNGRNYSFQKEAIMLSNENRRFSSLSADSEVEAS